MTRKLNDDRHFELMMDGAGAYHENRDLNLPPWPVMSSEYAAWREGWLEAMYKDYGHADGN